MMPYSRPKIYIPYPRVNCLKTIPFTAAHTYIAHILLFRERLSEKVHATITKGIVGGFEFTVLQRNLKEWYERPWMYVCECKRRTTKAGSTATVSGTVYWWYPMLPFGIEPCTFFTTTLLAIAVWQYPPPPPSWGTWIKTLKSSASFSSF